MPIYSSRHPRREHKKGSSSRALPHLYVEVLPPSPGPGRASGHGVFALPPLWGDFFLGWRNGCDSGSEKPKQPAPPSQAIHLKEESGFSFPHPAPIFPQLVTSGWRLS